MKCKHVSSKGVGCEANALTGDNLCFFHSPKTKNSHKEAVRAGGVARQSEDLQKLETLDLSVPKSILLLLGDTINRIRKVKTDGTMDLRTANSIGFLSGKMLEAQKMISFEERVEKLEERLNAMQQPNV